MITDPVGTVHPAKLHLAIVPQMPNDCTKSLQEIENCAHKNIGLNSHIRISMEMEFAMVLHWIQESVPGDSDLYCEDAVLFQMAAMEELFICKLALLETDVSPLVSFDELHDMKAVAKHYQKVSSKYLSKMKCTAMEYIT